MPHYKFQVTDGTRTVSDISGLHLRDDEAALREANNIASDLRDAPDEDWRDWIVEVTDDTGRAVATVSV
jgi:hypothetical protein